MPAPRLVRGPPGDGGVWSRVGAMAVDPSPLAFVLVFFSFFVFVGDSSAPFALAGRSATTALRQELVIARRPRRPARRCAYCTYRAPTIATSGPPSGRES